MAASCAALSVVSAVGVVAVASCATPSAKRVLVVGIERARPSARIPATARVVLRHLHGRRRQAQCRGLFELLADRRHFVERGGGRRRSRRRRTPRCRASARSDWSPGEFEQRGLRLRLAPPRSCLVESDAATAARRGSASPPARTARSSFLRVHDDRLAVELQREVVERRDRARATMRRPVGRGLRDVHRRGVVARVARLDDVGWPCATRRR